MENKKCSNKKHSEINAILFCPECRKYLCNKCHNLHSELFDNHHSYNLDKNLKDIFTGFCKQQKHNQYKLQFFCKIHNELCCMACLCKYDEKENGQHKNCDICKLEDIKSEKKNNLNENIKILEEFLNELKQSIKEIQILFEKMNENKEKLKIKIQKIFTKIRNSLNEREDELLSEVDNQFNDLFFNEELIKESQNLSNKVKTSLEKGKIIEKEWNDDNKLNSLIHDCINIEKIIKNISNIKESIEKCKYNKNIIIDFNPDKKEEINIFLDSFKNFGMLLYSNININLNNSNIIKYIK